MKARRKSMLLHASLKKHRRAKPSSSNYRLRLRTVKSAKMSMLLTRLSLKKRLRAGARN